MTHPFGKIMKKDQSDMSDAECYLGSGEVKEEDDPEAECKEDVELFVYTAERQDIDEDKISILVQ